MQYDADDQPVLVGIVSASGPVCAHRNFPTIHVRTSAYEEFLRGVSGIEFTQATEAVIFEEEVTPNIQFEEEGTRFSLLVIILVACAGVVVLIIIGFLVASYMNERRKTRRDNNVPPQMPNSSSMEGPSTPTLQPPPPVVVQLGDTPADSQTGLSAQDVPVPPPPPPSQTASKEPQGSSPPPQSTYTELDRTTVPHGNRNTTQKQAFDNYDPYEGLNHKTASSNATAPQ